MLHRNVENFIGCDSSYRTASIVLYGARDLDEVLKGLSS